MPFTPEELAEMAAADAEIEAAELTIEDYRETDARDRAVRMERKGLKGKKVAAQQKAWYEANRDKVAAQKKAYREANRDKVAAQQKAYREANRDKVAAQQKAYREANRDKYNEYMREYLRQRRQKSAAAGCARPDSGRAEKE